MIKYLKTEEGIIHEINEIEEGSWVRMINPTAEECERIAKCVNIDVEDIMAPLDSEESARLEIQKAHTLIIVDIPTIEMEQDKPMYTTVPLGIILTAQQIITVCNTDILILQNFVNNQVREFSTKKKLRFVYQILNTIALHYQEKLRIIDRRRMEIEQRVEKTTEDADLINLHKLESMLVYFATSLHANEVVLNRLIRYKRLEQYPEDEELLDDVMIETKQAIEMTTIYRDIISGTRELMATIISNRLNNVMKRLTAITIIMAIPTVISGFYGMNVNEAGMPFSDSVYGFMIIGGLTALTGSITWLALKRKDML
ncbi:MAG: magnesium transporter CorA family protein [Eubacteriales bacterium]